MAYSYANQKSDFDDLYLSEFGESVTLIDSDGNETTINAIVIRPGRGPAGFVAGGAADRFEALISQTAANGSTSMAANTYKLKFLVQPDDAAARTVRVSYVKGDYGAWRVGLVA